MIKEKHLVNIKVGTYIPYYTAYHWPLFYISLYKYIAFGRGPVA